MHWHGRFLQLAHHVDMLVAMVPFTWKPSIKSQEREGTEDVLIQL